VTTENTVRTLLEAASITIPDEEITALAKTYPALRAQADGLYLPELEFIDPAVDFDPTAE
jgi:hypothetical protein